MLLASLLIGLSGGMHCGLMCGPLQTAVFHHQKMNLSVALYHAGRILTYVLIGLLFYSLGEGISFLGLQKVFIYIISAYVIYFYVIPSKWRKHHWIEKIELMPFRFFGKHLRKWKYKNTPAFRFFSGMLNGLLPCGLVYMAAANSLLANNLLLNISAMVLFGMGTVPWLIGSQWLLKLPLNFKSLNTQKLKPYLAAIVVIFLLARTVELPFLHHQHMQENETKVITNCNGDKELFQWNK